MQSGVCAELKDESFSISVVDVNVQAGIWTSYIQGRCSGAPWHRLYRSLNCTGGINTIVKKDIPSLGVQLRFGFEGHSI